MSEYVVDWGKPIQFKLHGRVYRAYVRTYNNGDKDVECFPVDNPFDDAEDSAYEHGWELLVEGRTKS